MQCNQFAFVCMYVCMYIYMNIAWLAVSVALSPG